MSELTAHYATPWMRWGDDGYYQVAGTSPWVPLLAHPHPWVKDTALDMLRLQSKYQRWPWWRPIPPRVFEVRFIDGPGLGARLAGWLLTAYVIWRSL